MQIYTQTSEKYKACFNISYSECRVYSRLASNYTQTSESLCKRVNENLFSFPTSAAKLREFRNIKLALIFLTASARYIRGLPQIYTQTSESLCKRVNENLFSFPTSAAKLREFKNIKLALIFPPSVRICNADVLSISIYNALTSINPIELAQAGT